MYSISQVLWYAASTRSFRSANEPIFEVMSTEELQQIRMVFQGLQTLYQKHLPKVNPTPIHDLLIRELNKKSDVKSTFPPFYMVEIKTGN